MYVILTCILNRYTGLEGIPLVQRGRQHCPIKSMKGNTKQKQEQNSNTMVQGIVAETPFSLFLVQCSQHLQVGRQTMTNQTMRILPPGPGPHPL